MPLESESRTIPVLGRGRRLLFDFFFARAMRSSQCSAWNRAEIQIRPEYRTLSVEEPELSPVPIQLLTRFQQGGLTKQSSTVIILIQHMSSAVDADLGMSTRTALMRAKIADAMPIVYPDGTQLYAMKEALRLCHISRSTYVRWLATGKIRDTINRDRNGWRVFTAAEIENLKAVAFALERPQRSLLKFDLG
jgi:hypothetical protein